MKKLMNFLDKKNTKKLIVIILAFLSICVFALNLNIVNLKGLESHSRLAKFFEKITKSFNGYNVAYIPMFIAFYYLYSKLYFDGKKLNKTAMFLSIFFSLFMVLGYSYQKTNSWDLVFGSTFQLFKSIIVALGYYSMFYILIKKLYIWLDDYKMKECKGKITNFIFEKHPFILPFIIILIMWLPYIVFYYPGIAPGADTINQLHQFFHIEEPTQTWENRISDDVYINNNHPAIHTVMIGEFMRLGKLFNNTNLGMFLYVSIQLIVTNIILSYTFVWMKKRKIPIWLRIATLVIYSFLSYFPLFAISYGKDTYATIFTVGLVLMLFEVIIDNEKLKNKRFILLIMILELLVMLFRNDGIYRVIPPLFVLLFIKKEQWKKIFIILIIPLILYESYSKILLPALKVTPGSIKEMLSIPVQQTARVVAEHGTNAYTDEDIEKISKVLSDYDTMGEDYNPQLSDPIKNRFNKDSTKGELLDYFKVWFKNFFKYPTDYIQATINNTFAHFDPNRKDKWIGYVIEPKSLEEFNIKFIEDTKSERETIEKFHFLMKEIPVIGMMYSVGFYINSLLIILGYFVYKKEKRFIVAILPLIMVLLICMASPINGGFRYAFPIIMSFPIILAMMIYVSNYSEIEIINAGKISKTD